jgi:hypothetical protein
MSYIPKKIVLDMRQGLFKNNDIKSLPALGTQGNGPGSDLNDTTEAMYQEPQPLVF